MRVHGPFGWKGLSFDEYFHISFYKLDGDGTLLFVERKGRYLRIRSSQSLGEDLEMIIDENTPLPLTNSISEILNEDLFMALVDMGVQYENAFALSFTKGKVLNGKKKKEKVTE